METIEQKRDARWESFINELNDLVKKHNVEIVLESEIKGWELEYFISFDFKNDESKEWEEGTNDYFQKRCNYVG